MFCLLACRPGLARRSCGLTLTLDDFQRVSDRVPFICDLKPSGKYVMEDIHKVGGTPAVLKYLDAQGLINRDCMTVTGERLPPLIPPAAPPPLPPCMTNGLC